MAHPDGQLVTVDRPALAGGPVVLLAAGLGAAKSQILVEASGANAPVRSVAIDTRLPGVYRVEITLPVLKTGRHMVGLRAGDVTGTSAEIFVINT